MGRNPGISQTVKNKIAKKLLRELFYVKITPMTYDLTIIGGGPAGVAAGVYAARKRLKTVFITGDFQSQSVVSEGIENWIGTVKIAGQDLAKNLEAHLRAYAADSVDMKIGEWVKKIDRKGKHFAVTTDKNIYETKAILVASGSRRRKLDVPGADKYENKGIVYCASCDGPLYAGSNVAVIGGGNAAFETAAQLLAYCPSVTLLQRSEKYRADPVTVEKVLSHPHMHAITNTELIEVKGDQFAKSLTYKEKSTGEIKELPVDGIFAEIGSIPNTDFVKDVVKLDEYSRIIVDPKTQRSSTAGIWAAGDVTDGLFHQNNIAAGDAVKALEDIYLSIHAH